MALLFTILVTISILIGGAVEFIPLILVKEMYPPLRRLNPGHHLN